MMLRLFLAAFLIFFLAAPLRAEEAPRTTARLISAVSGTRHQSTVQVGIEVVLNDGWKTYWRTPGEAGLAPVFDWAGSENLKQAAVRWPAPHRFRAFDMDNFGYKDRVIFPVDIALDDPGRPLALRLKLDLLVCKTLCVPESHRLSLDIPAHEAKVSSDHAAIAAAVARVPVAGNDDAFRVENAWLEEDGPARFLNVSAIVLSAPAPDADLFVEAAAAAGFGRPDFSYSASAARLNARIPVETREMTMRLAEVLEREDTVLTFVDRGAAFERIVKIAPAHTARPAPALSRFAHDHLDLEILIIAFLGGLILNVMPCVLPILSLKVLSVIKHGGKDHRIHRAAIFKTFLASALGIVFSFLVLASALSALKAAGQTIGWGIQFQHPGFLIFLMTILTLFALNLWGLFEIRLPRFIAHHTARFGDKSTRIGDFLSGAFVALLAMPCTAPFLGTAVGFALAGSVADIFVIFTALGIGLASPYLVLSVFPQVFRRMPAPGRWMLRVRQVLGVFLFATALWLAHVLVTISTQPTLDSGWQTFHEALIAPAVDSGQTVVVDITADWCLTCKTNKRLVLDQKDIVAALSGPNILRLQGDWTARDESIAAYLRRHGRYGVPFNIVYGPGAPDGIILSELLTKREVMDALSEAAGE